mgnify:CR=1 FL=1
MPYLFLHSHAGKKMINHNKENVLLAKLLALNQTITRLKHRCKSLWPLIKQIWYLPFTWSLAWFSYWIFYSVIVSNQPLTQVNPLNYVGMTISIAALLIAGYTSGKSINSKIFEKINVGFNLKKKFSFRKIHDKKKDQRRSFTEEFIHKTKVGQREQLKPEIKSQLISEPSQIQSSCESPQEPSQIPLTPNVFSSQGKRPDQTSESQEIPPDCLVCPKLVNCNKRQSRIIDSGTPCPFARNSARRARLCEVC